MGEMFLKSFHLIVSFARAVMFIIWNTTTGNSTASRILIQCFLRLNFKKIFGFRFHQGGLYNYLFIHVF